ncbi:glutaredoxin family protein [Colwellia sp. MB3u-4]|uniref:glutaredoxin family protein n=1 Tax=Colwellia sp. MB3u-4 TaxID=2759822 RepID=UPI0015F69C75|nr:glutaredoxin family protein [Colwellia sp. MB3u-4]MBA6289763.1 glutaredoxin family protein [Colwellia sp. MB3u-4]
MQRITLYTMTNCPHCQTAKRYLEEKNIAFRLCNVKTPAGQKEFAKLNLRGVPVLKVGNQVLKGFNVKSFNELYQDN